MGNLPEDLEAIEYENGSGDKRSMGICWHDDLGVVNLSFYDYAAENELVFAEDFGLRTAIELRNRLTQIIEAATQAASLLNESNVKETNQRTASNGS